MSAKFSIMVLIKLTDSQFLLVELDVRKLKQIVKRRVNTHMRLNRLTYCADAVNTECILATSSQVNNNYTEQPTKICPAQGLHSTVWHAKSCGCSATMMRIRGPLEQLPMEIWGHIMNYL